MTAILLDLFGTLVSYSPSRTEQGYPLSAAVLERAGCRLAYEDWLRLWASISEGLDRDAERTGVEFSMADAFAAFARPAGIDGDDPVLAVEFVGCYLQEWSRSVRPIDGVAPMLGRLRSAGHTNVVVSNTHDADLVRGHLDELGIAPHLHSVVTSVEVGLRKPRPEIYAVALAAAGAGAEDAVFVGDTHVADYEGPTAVGIEAFLIVPDGAAVPHGVPVERRLRSILELEHRL